MRLEAPDERLRAAAALVYVADLAGPSCDDDDAHHLLDVLRLGDGASVAAGDGAGGFRLCRLVVPGGRSRPRRAGARLDPEGPIARQAAPPPGEERTVAFGLVKGDRSEWAVQKLTEIGLDRIVPLLTARTVVRLDPAAATRRGERLRRVAREAAAQSRRTRLPDVAEPQPLGRFLATAPPAAVALAEPGGSPLAEATRCVVVGPEGGFSDDERSLAEPHVGLGPTVLRAETAAVVAGVLLCFARKPSLSVLTSD